VAAGMGMITQTQISIVHTVFNIATTVLLFPASGGIVTLAKKIGRVEEDEQDDSKVLLDDRMLETPGLALQTTISEVVRMGQVVSDALDVTESALFKRDDADIVYLKDAENKVDKLSAGITAYALKLSALQISEREHQQVSRLLQVVSDIERVGDYCENIAECSEALHERKLSFSQKAAEQVKEMLEVCISSYKYALQAYEEDDISKAKKVIELETKADVLEISMRADHIKRLTHSECNAESGVVYLDALVCLERISDHARNIAEEVLAQAN